MFVNISEVRVAATNHWEGCEMLKNTWPTLTLTLSNPQVKKPTGNVVNLRTRGESFKGSVLVRGKAETELTVTVYPSGRTTLKQTWLCNRYYYTGLGTQQLWVNTVRLSFYNDTWWETALRSDASTFRLVLEIMNDVSYMTERKGTI